MPKEQPKYPIDLGKKMHETLPGSTIETPPSDSDEMFYPSLYLEWEKPYNFPEEGTMTVRFKKTSEENRKRGEDTTQRVNLDILEILDTKATKGGDEDKEESSGDVLDREMKKVERKKRRAARAADKASEAEAEAADDEETY